MITISVNTWHYKLLRFCSSASCGELYPGWLRELDKYSNYPEWKPPSNLCTYFQGFMLLLLVLLPLYSLTLICAWIFTIIILIPVKALVFIFRYPIMAGIKLWQKGKASAGVSGVIEYLIAAKSKVCLLIQYEE